MARGAVLCIVAALLAGCATPAAPPNEDPAELATFWYICDHGPAEDPCRGTLSTEATVEPAVAIDPSNPKRVAVAAAVAHPTDSPSVRGCTLTVWVSADAGGQWDATVPTPPPLDVPASFGARCVRSPSLAFDAQGRLHLVAFDSVTDPSGLQPLSARNIYLRSDDFGGTWEHAAILFDESNHPWIAVASDGTLVVTSRSGAWAKIARSEDAGETWTRHEPAATMGCILPSRPTPVGEDLLFACARYEGDGPRGVIQAVRVDPTDGSVEIRGSVPFEDPLETPVQDTLEYARPYLAGFPDGRVVMHFTLYGNDRADAYLATSGDGGRTWAQPAAAAALLESGGNPVDLLHASGPYGSTHMWVVLSDAGTKSLEHVVLDALGNVTHRRTLASDLLAQALPTDDAAKGFAYEGAALAWAGDVGVLAWEHPLDEGSALRVARLVAHPPGAP